MSGKAKVTEGVRISGVVSSRPHGFGASEGGVSVAIIADDGREIGLVVTDESIPAAVSLAVGQRVTCYGTFFTWPGKDIDELWGTIQPYAHHEQEAA
ncbi:hypothetical protein GCM10025867_48890 (plasmid) [Frondihabitans sucicola]|uniref:DNA-binding protein n=1 Tax=Frondihabitans sucicola TaxID=1268041 RepID=A0ABM8GVZ6_9MICO|nr:hypothetical protein [Frondihabitans sucicola]BDZ52648.1 hypothetical protein GCM10025867_48890 [Frondihabitans sucicola]